MQLELLGSYTAHYLITKTAPGILHIHAKRVSGLLHCTLHHAKRAPGLLCLILRNSTPWPALMHNVLPRHHYHSATWSAILIRANEDEDFEHLGIFIHSNLPHSLQYFNLDKVREAMSLASRTWRINGRI